MDGQIKERGKQERLRSRWTSAQDKIFAELVAEQIQQGSRSYDVFDQKAWNRIRDQFNAKTGLDFSNKQLRKHLEVLRIRYYNLKAASEQPGQMDMPNYELWQDFIEGQPKKETLKVKDYPIYDQLSIIFSEQELDGRYAQSSHYKGLESETAEFESPDTKSCPEFSSRNSNVPSPAAGANAKADNGRRKRPSETKQRVGGPHGYRGSQEVALSAMAEALADMISASKMRAVSTTRGGDDKFSITKCVHTLDEIEGMDEGIYFAALDLFDSPAHREVFSSLRHEQRLGWLQHKCKSINAISMG